MSTPLMSPTPASLPLFPQDEAIECGFSAAPTPNSIPLADPKLDLLQLSLSRLIAQPDCARRMLALEDAVPRAARLRYRTLMHRLWARRLATGARADESAIREALDDAWADPTTQRRWHALVQALGLPACARLARRSLSMPVDA